MLWVLSSSYERGVPWGLAIPYLFVKDSKFIKWLDKVRVCVRIRTHRVAHIKMRSVTKIAAQSMGLRHWPLEVFEIRPWGSLPQSMPHLADLPNCSGFWAHVLEVSSDPGCTNFVHLEAGRKWMLWVLTVFFWASTKSQMRRPISWLGAPRGREHHLIHLYPQIYYPSCLI